PANGADSSGGNWFALLASAAWTFFVPAEAYSIILMPTAGFVFVFWFIVWRIVTTDAGPAGKECLLLGLLIGVSAMAIATALFLTPIVVCAILLRRKAGSVSAVVPKVALLLTGIVVGTSPCWFHNYVVARDPVFLSAHGGVNFWIGN